MAKCSVGILSFVVKNCDKPFFLLFFLLAGDKWWLFLQHIHQEGRRWQTSFQKTFIFSAVSGFH